MIIKGGYCTKPIHFVGVSIPRSGHHLLVRLLESVFKDDLFYCEYYDEPNCCHSMPCSKRNDFPISFQKSHDFDLNLASDITGVVYLIQHRKPVWAALSAREHYTREQYDPSYGDSIGSNDGEYTVWLGRNILYYTEFFRKWILKDIHNSVVIDYDEFKNDASSVLTNIFERSGIMVPASSITEAVASTFSRSGRYGEKEFTPRSIERSLYVNKELLNISESIIIHELPYLANDRVFGPIDYADTLMWNVFEARRLWQLGALKDALSVIDDALIASPDIGLLLHERALLLQALGHVQEAQAALLRAVNLPPPHPQILSTLIAVSSALGDTTTTEDAIRTLTSLVGPSFIGTRYLEVGPSPVPVLRAPKEEALSQTPSDSVSREQDLERRETILASREAIAAERLRLISMLFGDPGRVHQTLAQLRAELQQNDAVIADLQSVAEERQILINRLDTGAKELHTALQELTDELQRKEAALQELTDELQRKEVIIGQLSEAAEERRQLVEVLDTEIRRFRNIAASTPRCALPSHSKGDPTSR